MGSDRDKGRKYLPGIGGAQDFGDEFAFEEDSGALKSILNNEGVTYGQTQIKVKSNNQTPKFTFTPAKVHPERFQKHEDKFEFFENKSGQIFFRQKVLPGSAKKLQFNSAKKNPHGSGFVRSLGTSESTMKPQRIVTSSSLKHKSPFKSNTAAIRRSPLAPRNLNKLNSEPRILPPKFGAITEKKAVPIKQSLPRQGISEKKVIASSGIPKPVSGDHNARQSLYKKFGNNKKPVDGDKTKVDKPSANIGRSFPAPPFEPSIQRLTRESFRMIPRESMAWLSQLPRESATFAELERMMNDNDKKFANEDDTDSFEALENRLRTPYKKTPSNLIVESKENDPNDVSGIEPMNDSQSKSVIEEPLNNLETSLASINLNESGKEEDVNSVDAAEKVVTRQDNGDVKDIDVPIMRRSISNVDMTSTTDNENIEAVIGKCGSMDNIAQVEQMSELVNSADLLNVLDSLDKYQEQLDRFRQEQDKLVRQEMEIIQKIKERKKEFKQLWGVSPINIKTKKTVIEPRPVFEFNVDINAKNLREDIENVKDDDANAATPAKDESFSEICAPETEKRVRFNPSHNETRSMTPTNDDDQDETLDVTPLSSHGKSKKQSRKSFDSLKCSMTFLKTPQTLVRNTGIRNTPSATAAPTPMALRNLSNRVMAEFAALYSDSSDDTDTTSAMIKPQMKLKFDN